MLRIPKRLILSVFNGNKSSLFSSRTNPSSATVPAVSLRNCKKAFVLLYQV
ncbi:MAG: hypothetical protein PQJ46_15520 [Spirochaetales bacterium]|nr:hypothetical protein [Spirochaetales bacterium]